MNLERLPFARELPSEWDDLAEVIFQRRPFLQHAEVYNPCSQRYFLLWEEGQLAAGAVVYTLPVSLFTFSRIPSLVKMNIIGLPASVSAPGAFGKNEDSVKALVARILEQEKGLILGLNFHPDLRVDKVVHMNMLPSVGMNLGFDGFPDYLSRLRAPYRRRAKRIQEKFREVERVESSCRLYSEAHHQLYLQILKKTPSKLEVLSRDFFAHLPDEFSLTTYSHQGRIICWHINARDKETLFFFFGGHDYFKLQEFQAYFNNLFGILQEGIQGGFTTIDLGQTAETAKLKIGGFPVQKMMFLYFSNPILNGLLKVFRPFITYRAQLPELRTFKAAEEPVIKPAL